MSPWDPGIHKRSRLSYFEQFFSEQNL